MRRYFSFSHLMIAVAMAASLSVSVETASAQTADDISRALQPKAPAAGLTRSLSVTPAPANPNAAAERNLVNRLRTRSISIEPVGPPTAEERQEIATLSKDKPAIDLEILFDYNSAVVGAKAVPVLVKLGNALSQPQFKGTVFLINGHTDAAGSPDYNQGLSQRRAQAVRKMLIEQYGLAPDTLIATGFGKEQLKVPQDPLAEANRRVQIVNTTVSAGR